jgi:uncharacterized protein (DUF58 family)
MSTGTNNKGVYVSLDDLIKLKYQAAGFSFLPRQPVNSLLSGKHASRLRGRGLNFEEIRRYFPGDDVRNIDWKVTARTRKTHTRVYTEERERPVLLVVDQRITMFFGTRVSMKSVTAAELAALGAWRTIDVGDRVGALIFNDTRSAEIRPHRSGSRVMQILAELVRYNGSLRNDPDIKASPEMLNEALKKANRIATHDFLVAIISDFYGMTEETRRLVKLMSRHNDVIVAMVYDPSATDPPKGSRMIVSDGTVQVEVDTGSGKKRMDLASIFHDRLKILKSELTRFGVPILPVQTEDPVTEQIQRVLGHRPVITGR